MVEKKHLPITAETQVHSPAATPLALPGAPSKTTVRLLFLVQIGDEAGEGRWPWVKNDGQSSMI